MDPLLRYRLDITAGGFIADPEQEAVMAQFQQVYEAILKRSAQSLLTKYWHKLCRTQATPKGLYVYGKVGSGKTWLMDIFYDCLPAPRKMRLHFHHFMRKVHDRLTELQGEVNPLSVVAKEFRQQTSVLCFDELFVNDIADAMILGNLFKALIKEGIVLVITSNIPPDKLYQNGLQRDLFLPAIDIIKANTTVLELSTAHDYRLRDLQQAQIYFTPLNQATEHAMREAFALYAHGTPTLGEALAIGQRSIPTLRLAQEAVWFDFRVICNIPRSQRDYLDIAQIFRTVLISNVQPMTSEQDNIARYFINLVDVFYDHKTKLIISASVPIGELYQTGPLAFEFIRTKSRLIEMQSSDYLNAATRDD